MDKNKALGYGIRAVILVAFLGSVYMLVGWGWLLTIVLLVVVGVGIGAVLDLADRLVYGFTKVFKDKE